MCSPFANGLQKEERLRRQKHNRQQLLKRPCTCGRTYGWYSVSKQRKPLIKMAMNARGDHFPKEIKPKYTITDSGPSEAYWTAKDLAVTIETVGEMWPFVIKRYPSLLIRDTDYAKALRVNTKIYRPFIDERFSKPWMEWWLIALDARAHGHNAAASKHAVEVIYLPRLRQEFYGLDADTYIFNERVLKEVTHEVGHAFGLGHCPKQSCVMHFSSSLVDTDYKAKDVCNTCRKKLHIT